MSIRSAGWLLGPAGLGDHAVRRLASLYAGLVLFGLSVALMVNARLGVDPWDVLHQGIARRTGIPFGWVVNGTGALVLLAWIPLRQRPGLGTVSNVIVVGLVAGAALPRLTQPGPLAVQGGTAQQDGNGDHRHDRGHGRGGIQRQGYRQ